jgi:DNA-binding XRE family transcriptional regulator
MNVREYEESCRAFAKESAEWGGVDEHKFYTTTGSGEWEETCDNRHGGIDVSWAFHRSDRLVRAMSAEMFRSALLDFVQGQQTEGEPGEALEVLEKLLKGENPPFETGLRDLRHVRSLTQRKLADALGVSQQAIQKYESGQREIERASLSTSLSLADVLRVHPAQIIEDKNF